MSQPSRPSTSLPPLSPNYALKHKWAFTEGVETHGRWSVEYQFRPARGHHPHLLVVFASVGTVWGFGNQLDQVQCNILRIKDRFDGGTSYYIARDMDCSLQEAVQAVIRGFAERLGLNSREQVTLLGHSKGGSAALYYGVKYDYRNIVMSTPQYFLGSYSHNHGNLGASVLGKGQPAESVAALDRVLPELLEAEKNFDRNVYLLSSPADYQYEQEVKHMLPALRRYDNFSFLFLRSPTIRRHEEVVRQGMPLVWSVLHALTEGMVPRLGELELGSDTEDPRAAAAHLAALRAGDTALAVLRQAAFDGGTARLAGHAFLPGRPGGPEPRETKRLVLERDGRCWVFPLETTKAAKLYREYWDSFFCEYADGGFAGQGLGFDGLPLGRFQVSVCITGDSDSGSGSGSGDGSAGGGIERRTRLVARQPVDRRTAAGGTETVLRGGQGGIEIVRRSVIGTDSPALVVEVKKCREQDRTIDVEGVFFLPGRNADRAAHATYYLVLDGKPGRFSFPLQAGRNPAAVRRHVPPEDFGSYDFGYFTTPGGRGIDAGEVPAGRYRVLVSMSAGGALYTRKAGRISLSRPRNGNRERSR
ncbi:hypothetical protein [Streptomyces aidingensis]|uniref:Uncharacterized protein n=1 Tax=Streptomyces aidingensis TaxID=910347 RepID=A0A1I1R845_9ACTN|nr:hypothetical protein [Streptomyces aidingensis]SFD26490.1 hypothetical protein SAMN05421773_11249 [Streptomyces aidingensis]